MRRRAGINDGASLGQESVSAGRIFRDTSVDADGRVERRRFSFICGY